MRNPRMGRNPTRPLSYRERTVLARPKRLVEENQGALRLDAARVTGDAAAPSTMLSIALCAHTFASPHSRLFHTARRKVLLTLCAAMATTYENMVLREMHRHEHQSKKEWGKQHAPDSTVFGLETHEFARLESLKEKVADLCDLQPTPASMVRPPRKVRVSPHAAP